MTEPQRTPPGVDCWVDFNDIHGGKTAVLPQHFATPRRTIFQGDVLLAGDHEGNRCRAKVIDLDVDAPAIMVELDLSSFTPPAPKVADLVAAAPLSPGERVRGGILYGQTRPPADPRDTLADQMLASIQDALARGKQHVDDPRVHVVEPVVGCPWCVGEDRATALRARMSKRWPDEWPALDTWEARVLCARGDLARSES